MVQFSNSGNSAFEHALSGRRVLLTGHTGFTGGWLALWLKALGCKVTGLALAPATEPSLFVAAGISDCLESQLGDIRDVVAVEHAMRRAEPQVVFHLAAQPLVSRGFADPIETFATNVIGTAHVLEAARKCPSVTAVVCVTTDKVYDDRDWPWGYREIDRLGGRDPYASSKACAEMVARCYRETLALSGNGCLIATARGGNIIGGGDWSEDRIVPDFVRAVVGARPLALRNPDAVRPWQHVLALVHGYLVLAARLVQGDASYAEAWNFGPSDDGATSVAVLVEHLGEAWKAPQLLHQKREFKETRFLRLDSSRAREILGWRPPIGFAEAAQLTAQWYREYYGNPSCARDLTESQIDAYRAMLGTGK